MKYLLILLLLAFSAAELVAQNALSIGYFGETITHPGVKVGLNFPLREWDKSKSSRKGASKQIQKSFDLQPNLGFYYHRNYQTGLFVMPQIGYSRKNAKGAYTSFGVGAGYLQTFIPRVYSFENSVITKEKAGYGYLLSNYFITFGKDLSKNTSLPLEIYAQPQVLNASPNARSGIWYFALELGVKLKLE